MVELSNLASLKASMSMVGLSNLAPSQSNLISMAMSMSLLNLNSMFTLLKSVNIEIKYEELHVKVILREFVKIIEI